MRLGRNQQLVSYIAATATRKFPGEIIDAAKRALVMLARG